MALRPAPLLLLGAALGALVPGGGCGSSGHSLCYFDLKVSGSSQGLPQVLTMVRLDEQPIARLDSLTRRMEPLVPWMGKVERKTFVAPEWLFRADLESLSNLSQTGGLHTWQAIVGCEVGEDGSHGGFLRYGYNGRDFLIFEKETLRWVAAQSQAQKVKEQWENDPGWSQRNKVFLETVCIERLQRYLSYGKEALERTEPPVGKVTRKAVGDNVEALICQAYGFYPREIQATWRRGGEVYKYETFGGNVAPNSDGTYYVWLSIETNPEERDLFECHVEHVGLQEPLVLAWKKKTGSVDFFLPGILIATNVGLGMFLLRAKRRHHAIVFLTFETGLLLGLDIVICVSTQEFVYRAILGVTATVLFLLFHWFLKSVDGSVLKGKTRSSFTMELSFISLRLTCLCEC